MSKQLILMLVAGGFLASLCAQPVAVIAVLEGKATVTPAERHSQPAHSLDWLSDGVVLEAGQGARLVLAFSNGRRYELGSGGKVSVTADGPLNASGPLRELEKLPPMPRLPVINALSGTAAMGGMRVRDPLAPVTLLFPGAKLSTLPDHTVLHFKSKEGGARYKVEVGDPAGNVLYHTETAATTVNVPSGLLKPGQSYAWRIRAGNDDLLGQATFTTVSAETIARRAQFKTAIREADVDALSLLAAMDAQLGLLEEARDELRPIQAEHAQKLLEIIEREFR